MSLGETSKLRIRTPEGVSFALPLAGPVTRAAAWLLDLMVIMATTQIVRMLVQAISLVSSDAAQSLMIVAQFALMVGYSMFFEWLWRGQTIGKRLLRLRVMDERGLTLKPSQIVLRNLFRVIDLLPLFYLVGGISCALSRRCQRLGDLAAGTVVVRLVDTPEPQIEQWIRDGENSFRQYPHIEARLRQRVSVEEARLALDALSRRDELSAESRLEVFQRMADHYRAKATFPEEATLGLSDEQYLRNVVETVFRRRVTV